jgi:hypothetical protein
MGGRAFLEGADRGKKEIAYHIQSNIMKYNITPLHIRTIFIYLSDLLDYQYPNVLFLDVVSALQPFFTP